MISPTERLSPEKEWRTQPGADTLESSNEQVLAVVASLGVLLAALWAGISGPEASYNPEVAILSITATAVIFYTAYARIGVRYAERRDRRIDVAQRRGLATAALAEVRFIDGRLRQIEGPDNIPVHTIIASTPVLDQIFEKSHLFSADTLSKAGRLRARLQLIGRHIEAVHNVQLAQPGTRTMWWNQIPKEARWAAGVLADLAANLEQEGGEMPAGGYASNIATKEFPPSHFGEYSKDKGWLPAAE